MNHCRHYWVALSIVLLILPAWGIADAQTPSPQGNALAGRIAYSVFDSERNTYDIYLADADGSDRRVVVAEASDPDLSPDCSEIAYRSWAASEPGLFSRQLTGKVDRLLVDESGAVVAHPVWSSDGSQIVFTSSSQAESEPRLSVTLPVTDDAQVVTIGDTPIFGETPNWMPDGRLTFAGCIDGECGLVVMNGDGTGPLLLTDHASDRAPDVSPDATRTIFMSNRDGNWEIYSASSDDGETERLTWNSANDGLPVWSPDGRYIAFVSDRGGNWGIWIMRPDGSGLSELWELEGPLADPLSKRQWYDGSISWSACEPGETQTANAGGGERGSVPSFFPTSGQPCEINLLEPTPLLTDGDETSLRFEWETDRPLALDEYYVLFVGGLLDEEPHMKGSFWDPVLEDRGPWSLEILETMAPLLELTDLRDATFETSFPVPDDGLLRWEVQVRRTGRAGLLPSPIDAVVCKRDAQIALDENGVIAQ